jgi:hypothetical protein
MKTKQEIVSGYGSRWRVKNSQIMSVAEMSRVERPIKPNGGCRPGHV